VFLDISAQVATQGERGLLGLAFDPNFANNGYVYLNYSETSNGNTTIERFQASGPGKATASVVSAHRILSVTQPTGETSHKAGWIGFRPGEPDNLYITTGDGAWRATVADPYLTGQNLASNLGKMLRVDVRQDAFAGDSGRNYAIPVDNPWADGTGANPEIWAYGLRNPFRASFDSLTGDLWIGDVGFTQWDEVDFLAATAPGGANFGWNLREGSSGAVVPGAVDPVFNTPVGTGAALIGGLVYRGSFSSLYGRYVFADYVTGRIRSLNWDGSQVSDVQDMTEPWLAGLGSARVSSFGTDRFGQLYLTDLTGGRVLALASTVPEPGSLGLALAGAGLLAAQARRQRRRKAGSRA
jgi:glucose/arabinose dehydrogenase